MCRNCLFSFVLSTLPQCSIAKLPTTGKAYWPIIAEKGGNRLPKRRDIRAALHLCGTLHILDILDLRQGTSPEVLHAQAVASARC
jgi:hypothetical protein